MDLNSLMKRKINKIRNKKIKKRNYIYKEIKKLFNKSKGKRLKKSEMKKKIKEQIFFLEKRLLIQMVKYFSLKEFN